MSRLPGLFLTAFLVWGLSSAAPGFADESSTIDSIAESEVPAPIVGMMNEQDFEEVIANYPRQTDRQTVQNPKLTAKKRTRAYRKMGKRLQQGGSLEASNTAFQRALDLDALSDSGEKEIRVLMGHNYVQLVRSSYLSGKLDTAYLLLEASIAYQTQLRLPRDQIIFLELYVRAGRTVEAANSTERWFAQTRRREPYYGSSRLPLLRRLVNLFEETDELDRATLIMVAERGADEESSLQNRTLPLPYPQELESKRLDGVVEVSFQVSKWGRVSDVAIVSSHPAGVFDDAVIAETINWHFSPKIEGGKLVSHKSTDKFEFYWGTRDPIPIDRTPPEYPLYENLRGVRGWVAVEFVVTKEGNVKNAKVFKFHPTDKFNNTAVEAVSKWTYEPALFHLEPVDSQQEIVLSFELD